MKRNQYFDHNHSQKALSCRYNMDTNRVEAQFNDGTIVNYARYSFMAVRSTRREMYASLSQRLG